MWQKKYQLCMLLCGAVLLLGVAVWFLPALWTQRKEPDQPTEADNGAKIFPLPALSPSPYLNVRPEATYIGVKACAECHPREYTSYLRTHHSRSLNDIDVAAEPPSGEFFHPASSRRYRVWRKGKQLWHSESLRTSSGKELLLSAYPMRYLFGSGTHTRSYVLKTDGFLVESPITWYPAKKKWWMSPGYDTANHWSFERVTSFRCLHCHAGQVEPVDNTINRLNIRARAIDCERCHGPGSLHAEHWQSAKKPRAEADLTIVNPAKLPRDRNEAVCGQCHIGNASAAEVRGRSMKDFRPGLLLTDFNIDYDFQSPTKTMTVVGHFRQMRMSRCYQASKTLTCTTCHDPHHKPTAENQISYYRKVCHSCHSAPNKTCGLEEKTRLQRNLQNSCIACHMPTGPTTVPHTAFTHHRIGLHKVNAGKKTKPDEGPGTLVPFYDVSHLPQIDRDRCLGLAYLQMSHETQFEKHGDIYRERSRELLEKVRGQGLRDGDVDVALAMLCQSVDPKRSIQLAKAALKYPHVSATARRDALSLLTMTYYHVLTDLDHAYPYVRQLVRCRRDAEDWAILSMCRWNAGELTGAVKAAERAVEINPSRPDLHGVLADAYQRVGNREAAAIHRRRAAELAGKK